MTQGEAVTTCVLKCEGKCKPLDPLYTGKSLMCTLTNSEDPDEMQHNAAFHQGLPCLPRLK